MVPNRHDAESGHSIHWISLSTSKLTGGSMVIKALEMLGTDTYSGPLSVCHNVLMSIGGVDARMSSVYCGAL